MSTNQIDHGVEFLAELFHTSNLQYSALNTARSALSIVVKTTDGVPFGKQPIVKRLERHVQGTTYITTLFNNI